MFKFLELHEKVGFQDAVKMLAQKFGADAARSSPREAENDGRRDSALREALLKMHEIAADYFARAARRARPERGRDSSSPTAASPRRRSNSSGLDTRRRAAMD